MKTKGFTLIELLVVIVIIGILVAIALPNFIKIKDKAKEAEVKQNLHSIQLAIERYATDADGNYPFYIFGGDARYNIGTVNALGPGGGDDFWGQLHQAFDMFWGDWPNSWDYNDSSWADLQSEDLTAAFGDTIAYEGYMPKFPNNPFLQGTASVQYSLDAFNHNYPYWACWGGYDGRHMFNTGFDSEFTQVMKYDQRDPRSANILEFPGQFSYHARWQDGVTNYGHMLFQTTYNDGSFLTSDGYPGLNDQADVSSLDVAGYDLIAFGSPRTKGQDLDNSEGFTSSSGFQVHYWRTGYLTLGQERNPYVQTGDYPNVQDYDERPYSDSIYDFFIIHLGSGMDKKVGNPLDLNT